MTLLTINEVHGGYGEVNILNGVSVSVARGEIVTIAGANGCGKSTLARAIIGLLPRVTGELSFDGRSLLDVDVETRQAIGLSYVPQVLNVFPNLTIEENLLAVEGCGDPRTLVDELLDQFADLKPRRRQLAQSLSGGERQQLAIARALVLRPKLVVMDEPSAALSPKLVEHVFSLIRGLATDGIAVLLVEQRAREALEFSDRGYILGGGRVVAEDTAAGLLADQNLARLFLGH